MKFTKAHAYGNDFLYVEERDVQGCALSALAREMCDRHTGVGADGLIVFGHTHAGARMRLHNADGSQAEVSGNGVRGLAALLLRGDDRASCEGISLRARASASRKSSSPIGSTSAQGHIAGLERGRTRAHSRLRRRGDRHRLVL